jgi:hypothetical protein
LHSPLSNSFCFFNPVQKLSFSESVAPHSRLPKLLAALNGAKITKENYIDWSKQTGVSVQRLTAWCKELQEAQELAVRKIQSQNHSEMCESIHLQTV